MTNNSMPPEGGNPAEADTSKYTPEQTQAYIKQLRDEAKAHRLAAEATAAKLNEVQRLQDEADQKRLKEQGEFKTLFETAEEARKKASAELEQTSAYKAAFQAALDARIKAIPEGMRSLVPEGMDPIALSTWLDKNAALLSNRNAPNLDPGVGSSASGQQNIEVDPVEAETARKMGYSPLEYAKIKAKFAGG